MGDDDGGTALHDLLEGGPDLALGDGIHRGGGVVENEDAGVAQDGPGEGDTLALTPGEAVAAFPHHRVVPVGELDDEFVRLGEPRRQSHLLFGGLRGTEGDVLGDRGGEQEGLLEHHRYFSSQVVDENPGDVGPVDLDRSLDGVVEAGNQVGEGGLPRTGRSDQGDRGPPGDPEIDAVEDGRSVRIGERDPRQPDLAGSLGKRSGLFGIPDLRSGTQQLGDPRRGGRRSGKFGEEPSRDPERELEGHQVLGEGHEVPEGHLAAHHPTTSDEQHHRRRQSRDQLEERNVGGSETEHVHGASEDAVGRPPQTTHHLVLLTVGLDHPHSRHHFLHHVGQVGQALLNVPRHPQNPAGVEVGQQQEGGDRQRHQQTEHGVESDQHPDHHDEHDEVGGADRQHGEDQPHLRQVARGPGHQLAGRHPVVEAEGETLEVFEDTVAKVGLGPVGEREGEEAAASDPQGLEAPGGDEQAHQRQQEVTVPALDGSIDDQLGEIGGDHHQDHPQKGAGDTEHRIPAILEERPAEQAKAGSDLTIAEAGGQPSPRVGGRTTSCSSVSSPSRTSSVSAGPSPRRAQRRAAAAAIEPEMRIR